MLKNTYHFFAFDLGATSGRSILGILQDGKIQLKELTRFPNKIIRIQDKYYWDIFALYEALKDGLSTAASQNIRLDARAACICPNHNCAPIISYHG